MTLPDGVTDGGGPPRPPLDAAAVMAIARERLTRGGAGAGDAARDDLAGGIPPAAFADAGRHLGIKRNWVLNVHCWKGLPAVKDYCWAWNSKGECRDGSTCRFQHAKPPTLDASLSRFGKTT